MNVPATAVVASWMIVYQEAVGLPVTVNEGVVEIGGAVNGDRVTECDRERAAVKGDGTADGAVAAQGARH